MNENQKVNPHSFKYEGNKIVITGVLSVDNYDEKSMEVKLSDGLLTIKGSDLKLEEMEVKSGIAILSGKLYALDYHAKVEKVGILKRIFR